ncbi:MAG: GNAT family N-acetyltransferase [Clostridiaceae bacterium]|jgi:ribosomal protein S18 acetylase RimI-like enzyme|nr:GNAT family N-acetyltransferase [Clostridiaceae bacterium]
MNIVYNDEKKELPFAQLRELFIAVGWSDSNELPVERRAGFLHPWIHSTLVISAWDGDRLVGAVRVLSDTIFRSVIYDLLVSPAYQGKGIGSELVRRCFEHFPGSGWLVGTEGETAYFYKKNGFSDIKEPDIVLGIPCKHF